MPTGTDILQLGRHTRTSRGGLRGLAGLMSRGRSANPVMEMVKFKND